MINPDLKYYSHANDNGMKCQWSTKKRPKRLMLNSDMSLYKEFHPDPVSGLVTECSYDSCPRQTDSNSHEDQPATHIENYAKDEKTFKEDYAIAFTKIINNGYNADTDLVNPLSK